MVTDGYGKMVTGMDIDSGMSYITYKPYGEINRTNSSGPDIYRYKYTAQEDDPELGLYYYKARWYDPAIARFTQADSIIDANSVQGMNQYMYTEGNPVNFRDPSGHKPSIAVMAGFAAYMLSQGQGEVQAQKNAMMVFAFFYKKKRKDDKTEWDRSDFGAGDIQKSDLGRWHDRAWVGYSKDYLFNPEKAIKHSDWRRMLGGIDKYYSDHQKRKERRREEFRLLAVYFKVWIPSSKGNNGDNSGVPPSSACQDDPHSYECKCSQNPNASECKGPIPNK